MRRFRRGLREVFAYIGELIPMHDVLSYKRTETHHLHFAYHAISKLRYDLSSFMLSAKCIAFSWKCSTNNEHRDQIKPFPN